MRSFRMSWFLIIIILSFTFNNLSEANHEKKLPSAVVVGTVYCDTCFQDDFSKASHFISGASVAVECGDGRSKPSFRKEAKTNEHGEFKVQLPTSVSKHVKKVEGCTVKLISSSEPYCAVASTATSSSLHLKSRKEGTHIFSAGFFTFKPLKQPNLCNQKPNLLNSKELYNTAFPPPIQDPPTPTLPPIVRTRLPPIPLLPMLPPLLPRLPFLPPLPGKTTQSKPTESSKTSQLSNQKEAHPEFLFPAPQIPLLPSPPPAIGIPLIPNPFQPPPILPPNPFLPPPIIPNPFQPPPTLPPIPGIPPIPPIPPIPGIPPILPIPGIPGLPPIPGLTPPPPPAFPFIPLPPIFPPRSPGFPGIPPASSSSSKKTTP